MGEAEDSILLGILRLLGPEKASDFFMGEPILGRDAWILLDYLRKHDHRSLYEDEDDECYILVMSVEKGKYIYVLLKNHDESRGYLLQPLTATDYHETVRLAKEEYEKCLGKNNSV
jgi:protease II